MTRLILFFFGFTLYKFWTYEISTVTIYELSEILIKKYLVQNYPLVHHSIPIQQMDQKYNTKVFQSLLYLRDSGNNFYLTQKMGIFLAFYCVDEDTEMTMADKLGRLLFSILFQNMMLYLA